MKRQNIVKDKSLDFAVQIVNLVKSIRKKEQEFDLTRQLVRSGTAIGALIYESEFAESKRDFSHKLMISLKEAHETRYWLELLHRTDYITLEDYGRQNLNVSELIKLLVAITKTLKVRHE